MSVQKGHMVPQPSPWGNVIARMLLMGLVGALIGAPQVGAAQVVRDIPFNSPGSWPDGQTRLDLYTPNGGAAPGAPTILDIHGGGYLAGDKRDDTILCGLLADRGYNVVSINYTLAAVPGGTGGASFPQAIRDVKAAVRWIRTTGASRGLSPTIVMVGSSAGATIGLTAAYARGVADFELLESPPLGGYRIDAVVGLYGRYDLVWDATSHGTPPLIAVYLGGPITNPQFQPLFAAAAAITYADACAPPTKLIHGSNDALVPYQHSVRLSGALSAAGVFNILEIVPGGQHGIGILGDMNFVSGLVADAIPQLLSHQTASCDPTNPSPPPANDACAQAAPLSASTMVLGTTLGASGATATVCGEGTDTRDVWYRFVPSLTRRYTLDTINPNPAFDSSLAVFASCDPGAAAVACDTQSGGPWCAQLRVALNAGQFYLVRVAGVNGSAGPFNLSVSAGERIGESPANDSCVDPMQVGQGTTHSTSAGADGFPGLCGDNDHDDVWFRFTCTSGAVYRFDTDGSTLLPDTTLQLRDGCEGAALACNNDASPGELFARIEHPMTPGQSVLIRLAGNAGSSGPFQLNIERVPTTVEGACCTGAACDIRVSADCGDGVWHELVACSAAPCAPPPAPGACCREGGCEMAADASACAGVFQGPGVSCGEPQNPTTCCRANFNQVGGVGVQDIFDFLAAYFAGQTEADFNLSGTVTVQDIFDFLTAYFPGCG